MKVTDLVMLENINQRLTGVQHRKAALMGFVKALDQEEQQLLALQKTYKDNKPLYDLIEDEPIQMVPPISESLRKDIEDSMPNIKVTRTEVKSKFDELKDAVLIVLEQFPILNLGKIHEEVCKLLPDYNPRYDAVAKAVYDLVDAKRIIKVHGAVRGSYAYNKKEKV